MMGSASSFQARVIHPTASQAAPFLFLVVYTHCSPFAHGLVYRLGLRVKARATGGVWIVSKRI